MNLELFFVKSSNWGHLRNIKSKNCFVIREFHSNQIHRIMTKFMDHEEIRSSVDDLQQKEWISRIMTKFMNYDEILKSYSPSLFTNWLC